MSSESLTNWYFTLASPRLNKGRFADNGNSGFLLKPVYMRSPGALKPKPLKVGTLT